MRKLTGMEKPSKQKSFLIMIIMISTGGIVLKDMMSKTKLKSWPKMEDKSSKNG